MSNPARRAILPAAILLVALRVDDVDTAMNLLETGLTKYYLEPDKETPAIAKSRV